MLPEGHKETEGGGARRMTLRDGVHILPAHAGSADQLRNLEKPIVSGCTDAHMLLLEARDKAPEHRFVALFDVGGAAVDEAADVEAVVRGLQAQHQKDDALLTAAIALFDPLPAAMKASA